MELIGDYSENPFEGLHNDVPITSMARGIEIDIRQMLDETNLPAPIPPAGAAQVHI
jgi:putative membrane protein